MTSSEHKMTAAFGKALELPDEGSHDDARFPPLAATSAATWDLLRRSPRSDERLLLTGHEAVRDTVLKVIRRTERLDLAIRPEDRR